VGQLPAGRDVQLHLVGVCGNLLCLAPGAGITLNGNAAKQYGIALNAHSEWVGKIVVATAPPGGGLSVQLPSVKAAPQVGPAQLPTVHVPGSTLPTLPAQLPSSSLAPPGSSSSKPASAPSTPSPGSDYPPPRQPIEDRVARHRDVRPALPDAPPGRLIRLAFPLFDPGTVALPAR
jgi:hypothetical protein